MIREAWDIHHPFLDIHEVVPAHIAVHQVPTNTRLSLVSSHELSDGSCQPERVNGCPDLSRSFAGMDIFSDLDEAKVPLATLNERESAKQVAADQRA
jgi:hypothetical protein